jgi:hypothetical protein
MAKNAGFWWAIIVTIIAGIVAFVEFAGPLANPAVWTDALAVIIYFVFMIGWILYAVQLWLNYRCTAQGPTAQYIGWKCHI